MSMQILSFVLGAFTVFPCSSLLRSTSSHRTLRAARAGVIRHWYEHSTTEVLATPLNFTSGYISHQNFAGKGPDSGEETLVFSNVGKVHGASFDMKFHSVDGVWEGKINKTQLSRDALIAQMNIADGTSTHVVAEFVDSVTQDPVIVPRAFLTVLDIDAGSLDDYGTDLYSHGGIESCRISPVSAFWVAKTHDLIIQHVGHSEYNFTGTEVGGAADNPTQAMDLTVGQQNRAVMVEIRNRSSFQIDFEASAGNGYREVMFSGPSQLVSGVPNFCLQPGILDLSSATLDLNNLDGSITGMPQEMHIRDVVLWTGETIDMTVSIVAGNYEAHNASKNGLTGGFVNINLEGNGATVGLSFSFQKSGHPYAVTNLLLTVADIDQERAEESYETVSVASGSGTYFLASHSSVVVHPQNDGFVRFASGMPGSAKNNPEDDHLTEWQKEQAVTLSFAEPTMNFTAYLSAQSKWPAGRNIMFGGDASLAC